MVRITVEQHFELTEAELRDDMGDSESDLDDVARAYVQAIEDGERSPDLGWTTDRTIELRP